MIRNGWLDTSQLQACTRLASPNFNERPPGVDIDLLVIHNISLPPGCYGGSHVSRFFCNELDSKEHPYFETIADLQVSAHCFIDRLGKIIQFVSFDDRAWHAGVSEFCGRNNCNDFSIGIELEGTDSEAYTDAQYETLVGLTKMIFNEYPGINPERIVGHSDIAPGRKTDPGAAFDWQRYKKNLVEGV